MQKAGILTALSLALILVAPAADACDDSGRGCAFAGDAVVGETLFSVTADTDHATPDTWWVAVDATSLVPATLPQPEHAVVTFQATSHVTPVATPARIELDLSSVETVSGRLDFQFVGTPDAVEAVPFTIVVDDGGLGNEYSGTLYIYRSE